MTYAHLLRLLALIAVVPAGATFYFFVFWRWFDTWKRHRFRAYLMMLGTLGGLALVACVEREALLSLRVSSPTWLAAIGWALTVAATLLAFVADRQIGIRVRSFTPFFNEGEKIALETTGAYGIVRHPIYAGGVWFQLGVFLASGYVAVLAACLVLWLGASWFTRQEERRLAALLEDPSAYERYREAVPALVPWSRGRRPGR